MRKVLEENLKIYQDEEEGTYMVVLGDDRYRGFGENIIDAFFELAENIIDGD